MSDLAVPAENSCIPDAATRLAELRVRGRGALHAARFSFAEALLRNAGKCDGRARAFVEARLEEVLRDLAERLPDAEAPAQPPIRKSAGAEMLRQLAAGLPEGRDDSPVDCLPVDGSFVSVMIAASKPGDGLTGPASVSGLSMELRSLRHFRRAWSRMSEEQRLRDAMADLPENAGPLNAHLLVHRSLLQMNALSPDYLGAFLTYAESLLWLETVSASGTTARR